MGGDVEGRSPRARRRVGRLAEATACAMILAVPAKHARAAERTALGPDAEGVYRFTSPSFNIECFYAPPGGTSVYRPPRGEAELSCDRAEPTYLHFSIGARGPAVLDRDPGERPCCSAGPALAYGQRLRMGPFTCASERDGLTCRRDDGAGFAISRSRAETF